MTSSTTPLEPRLRRRRRLIWATVLPAVILLVLAARFLTLPVHMGAAQKAHGGNDGAGMVDAADKLDVLNIVERWRAPFVEGTGRSISGDLDGGRADLELALSRTKTPQDDCTVRTNLVITVSQQADKAKEAGDSDVEQQRAQEALTLIEEGPEGCLDGSDDGNDGEAGRKQQEQQDKLEEQTGQNEPDDGQSQDPDEDPQEDNGADGSQEPEDPKKKELQERNESGQQDAEQQRRERESQEQGDPGGVDKPW